MPDLLAHSARRGRPAQAYDEHIRNVTTGALHRARAMLQHYTPTNQKAPTRKQLLEIIGDASSYHDFGKLDPGFQDTLHHDRYSANHIRHEDAGAVKLAKHGAMEAAGLVSSHHQGLVRYEFLRERPSLAKAPTRKLSLAPFRIESAVTQEATRLRMSDYERDHELLLGRKQSKDQDGLSRCDGFARRLLLSCLVDADHFDTARHYGNESRQEPVSPRWAERLASLDRYVAELRKKNIGAPTDATRLRQKIRDELYEKCRSAETTHRLRSCDAVVGSGKTTAVMAHLLQVAIERRLRHIIVVLPYTNIIRQSVETYRKALCLEGEDPAQIIAEHHHQAEFKDMDLRHLTTLWRAPIIVTTSVQFFETLAASHTGKLRKLHALPGSAVFLDEAHAALPSELWPQCWNWLMEWTNDWNGHLVLGSGSLAEFWCLPEFRSITEGNIDETPRLAAPEVQPLSDTLRVKSALAEHLRIRFKTRPDAVSGDDLIAWVESSLGPRLVIVNTVQSAAVLAKRMQDSGKQDVLHLSTALAPIHRAVIIDRIKNLLKYRTDWTLVATSMVEAGLDFSFATGFRQRCSTASLIQTGGRINRGAERGDGCEVWDFEFSDTDSFPDNRALDVYKRALGELFTAGLITPDVPADLGRICLDAMKMEFKVGTQQKALEPVRAEKDMDYPTVAELCRVIQSDTRTVLIDRELARKIRIGIPFPFSEIVQHSVQVYPQKIAKLGFDQIIPGNEELFVLRDGWTYDPECYGYMAGWLELEKATKMGGYFI
jgi:CRISPR-associated endonuclease/helicase Cas3